MQFGELESLYREYNIILSSKFTTNKDKMYATRCIMENGFAQGFRLFAEKFVDDITRYIDSLTRERVLELRGKLDKIADFPVNVLTRDIDRFMAVYYTITDIGDDISHYRDADKHDQALMAEDIDNISAIIGHFRDIYASIGSEYNYSKEKKGIIDTLLSSY